MPKIGVEDSLSDVTAALQQKGYDVVQLKNESDAQGCDCCVITGRGCKCYGDKQCSDSWVCDSS